MTAQSYRKDNPPRGLAGRARLPLRGTGPHARRRPPRLARRPRRGTPPPRPARPATCAAGCGSPAVAAADRTRGYWIEARRRLYQRAAAKAAEPGARDRLAAGVGRDGGAWRTQPQLVDFDTAFAPVIAGTPARPPARARLRHHRAGDPLRAQISGQPEARSRSSTTRTSTSRAGTAPATPPSAPR
ncbi:hypothetical protein ACU686_07300 [Yinghuangia aomiensis]